MPGGRETPDRCGLTELGPVARFVGLRLRIGVAQQAIDKQAFQLLAAHHHFSAREHDVTVAVIEPPRQGFAEGNVFDRHGLEVHGVPSAGLTSMGIFYTFLPATEAWRMPGQQEERRRTRKTSAVYTPLHTVPIAMLAIIAQPRSG